MARSIISVIMVVLLVLGLAVSVCAADSAYDFADSGVQVFAAPQSVATAPLVAAADTASATVGEYGYISNDFGSYDRIQTSDTSASSRVNLIYNTGTYFPSGIYSIKIKPSVMPSSAYMWYGSSQFMPGSTSFDGDSVIFSFSVSDAFTASSSFQILLSYATTVDSSSISINSYSAAYYTPADGISSGYTYSSGANTNTYTVGDTISASFGDQPAGDYLINIYQFTQGCDASYSLSYNGRKLATNEQGGVVTAVVSHGGGELALDGRFTATRTTNREISSAATASGTGLVRLDMMGPGTWIFEIYDIVAVPLTNSSVEQYGIFGPIVGFIRDQYSSLKSFLSGQFDSIRSIFAGDESGEFEQGTSQAADLADQQDQLEQEILGGFNDASGNVDPSTITIPNDVISGFSFLSQLFMLVFDGLGNYQVLVTVPLCIGIALICIGRGFNAADRALRAETYRNRRASRKGG